MNNPIVKVIVVALIICAFLLFFGIFGSALVYIGNAFRALEKEGLQGFFDWIIKALTAFMIISFPFFVIFYNKKHSE